MPAPAMPALDLARHARHVALPQLGLDGQRAISRARVALLGPPEHPGLVSARAYLEAAGVHAVTDVLDDNVDVALVAGSGALAKGCVSVRLALEDGHPVIERDDPRELPSLRTRRLEVDPAGSEPLASAAEQAAWTAAGALAACEVLWRLCATPRTPPASSPPASP